MTMRMGMTWMTVLERDKSHENPDKVEEHRVDSERDKDDES